MLFIFFFLQGVPILIFANKQDLPGAKEPKELEKLLGLYELSFAMSTLQPQMIKSSSTVPLSSSSITNSTSIGRCNTPIGLSSPSSSSSAAHHIESDAQINSTTTPSTHQMKQTHTCGSVSACDGCSPNKNSNMTNTSLSTHQNSFKGWFIQPACAITGEGLQEGLEALYDMIIKKRKLNKAQKKKR